MRTSTPLGASTATLSDVDILSELERRPRRVADHEREHRAYALLTEALADDPSSVLQRLVEIAADLCGAHTAGISLLDGDVFRWVAVAGMFSAARGGTMPTTRSPCGVCIDRAAPQLMHLPDRCFPDLTATPRIVEVLLVPFHDGAKPVGTVWIATHDETRVFDKEDERVVVALSRFASAICRALESAVEARAHARQTSRPPGADESGAVWSSGPGMRDVMTMVDRVADSCVSVLLTGESGVGKEVVARELHRRSDRRAQPFVKVNCAALPAELIESELFGHERGAFTGAQAERMGKFEFANHGTILLDEVGEMPATLQVKLLHVLQDQQFTKLGSNRTTALDVRIIAATNRDLAAMIREGSFREDLYYRLQVIEIHVPPLRERADEVPNLVDCFLRRYAEQFGKPPLRLSTGVREALSRHDWPGNVRELENTIKRFVILGDEALILAELRRANVRTAPNLPPPPTMAAAVPVDARALLDAPNTSGMKRRLSDLVRVSALATERRLIHEALDLARWNRGKVAREFGVSDKTLRRRMKACGITPSADAD